MTRLRVHRDGRLLLSSSQDKSARVWGTQQGRRTCLAEYWGHTKGEYLFFSLFSFLTFTLSLGVKDVQFLGVEQEQFASLGFDQQICIWQLETGQLLRTISLPSLPFCLGATPSSLDVIAGCADSKMYQYDTRVSHIFIFSSISHFPHFSSLFLQSSQLSLIYERHLDAVNTVTFFDGGRRFISSSDDKTLRYWEFGTPVEIKIHQEPHMHAMPAAVASEKNGWAAFQSMDNQASIWFDSQKRHSYLFFFFQILLYGISPESGYKLNRTRRFLGHLVAGNAPGLDFSPNG